MEIPWCAVYRFLKEWQTLVGALLALVAALGTIYIMRRQAADEDHRHRKQMHGKEMAARAQMPDALSEVCAYVREAGRYLTGQTSEQPSPPSSAITTLKQVIEHIDDNAAQRTFELLSWYQVQRTRMLADTPSRRDEPTRGDRLYDIILLQAYANSLFDYARNEEPTASTDRPTRDEMVTAFRNTFEYTVRNEQLFERLQALIASRHI